LKPDDIISYHDVVHAEKATVQKGMNYNLGKGYSVFLMSVRKGAPYADAFDETTCTLIYEGHDVPRSSGVTDPKTVDQPMTNPGGTWTENGKFYRAATDYKTGMRKTPELVKVYEKIHSGIWCYKGFFELVDAKIVTDGKRNVFKFFLRPVEKKAFGKVVELQHTRLIPTYVKVEVWKRDGGKCVQCGATENLHYDHDIPFSKGGSSLTADNVRLLCAKHNLQKSDKIMSVLPWMWIGANTVSNLHGKS
jgi:hypothetical protein